MSDADQLLAHRLRAHVTSLAEEIGERNVLNSEALQRELTVRFVAFVNEEPPFFGTRQRGSMVYAQAARHRGDDIRLMASLETIGCYSSEPGSQRYPPLFRFFYPNRGNF